MHAALSSKLSAFATRVAPAPNRVAERAPRTAVIECAHKKGTGSTKNGRDSNPKYLGVKKYGEEKVQVGSIIVRQRGNKVRRASRATRAREDGRRDRVRGFRRTPSRVDATSGVFDPRARVVFASTHRSMIERERASSHS